MPVWRSRWLYGLTKATSGLSNGIKAIKANNMSIESIKKAKQKAENERAKAAITNFYQGITALLITVKLLKKYQVLIKKQGHRMA